MPSKKYLSGLAVVAGLACGAAIAVPADASGPQPVTVTGNGQNAWVTSNHQLRTSNQDGIEALPFANFGSMGNNASDRVVIAGPTSRTIALSSLTVSATGGEIGVRIRAVEPTDGSCDAGHVVIVRGEDMSFVVGSDQSHSVEFPSPLIAKPAKSKQICLIAHADTTYVPASGAQIRVSGSGYLR